MVPAAIGILRRRTYWDGPCQNFVVAKLSVGLLWTIPDMEHPLLLGDLDEGSEACVFLSCIIIVSHAASSVFLNLIEALHSELRHTFPTAQITL